MARSFDNIADLKRNREIEGSIGIDIKINDTIFLTVLAATDANPAWKEKAQKALKEIERQRNAGATDKAIDRLLAALYADTLVKGWHGGQDEEGNVKAGGPMENAVPVPFNRQNCIDFLLEADDAMLAISTFCLDTKRFRIAQAERVIGEVGN